MKYFSAVTGAFVHNYEPLRLYIYDHREFPYEALNPLVKSLIYNDPRYSEASYLFSVTGDAEKTDFFVFPCDLNYFENREDEVKKHLEYFDGNEERHIFFDHRDRVQPYPAESSICFKVSVSRHLVSNTLICIPYMEMVDNMFWYLRTPREIRYDVSFMGEQTKFREEIADEISRLIPGSYLRLRRHFFHGGYLRYGPQGEPAGPDDPKVKIAQRREFIETSLSSKFVLALRGYGLNSFRFFEALSMGIPPILVSQDCALPYEDLIDYDRFSFRIDSGDAIQAAMQVRDIVSGISEEKYAEICRQARLYYDTYLSTGNFLYLLYFFLQRARVNGFEQGKK